MKSDRLRPIAQKTWGWLLLTILPLAFGGCRQLGWTESGFRDSEAVWKPSTTKSSSVSDAAGLSLKAREVENHLGVE